MKTFRVCLAAKGSKQVDETEIVERAHDGPEALRIAISRISKRRGGNYADALEVVGILAGVT